jgi:hypothetical protein
MNPKQMMTRAVAVLALAGAMGISTSDSWAAYSMTVTTAYGVTGVVPLVGQDNGVVDPLGEFTVEVLHDGQPLVGTTIQMDFLTCPDIRIANVQPFPGMSTSNCMVSATTDNNGVATFRIVGNAYNIGCSPSIACQSGSGSGARIAAYIGPFIQLLGILPAACFDQDGANGVGANDLSYWLTDFGCTGSNPMRSDYDGNGSVGANDLSIWLTVFGGGGSPQSAGSGGVCP